MSKNKRVFSCPECGTQYDAYPPDDHHRTAVLEPPTDAVGSVIKVVYDCKQCKHPITLYWYEPKIPFRVG
jgi:DNA-directed RNA polymerase subunit RPC12/RpoP